MQNEIDFLTGKNDIITYYRKTEEDRKLLEKLTQPDEGIMKLYEKYNEESRQIMDKLADMYKYDEEIINRLLG